MKGTQRAAIAAATLLLFAATAAEGQLRRAFNMARAFNQSDPQGWVTFPPVAWNGGKQWEGGSRLVMISVATRDPMNPTAYVQFQAGAGNGHCVAGSYIRLLRNPQTAAEPTDTGEINVYRVKGDRFRCEQLEGKKPGLGVSAFGAMWGQDIAGLALAADGLLAAGNAGAGPFFEQRRDLWAIWTGHVQMAWAATFPEQLARIRQMDESGAAATKRATDVEADLADLGGELEDLEREAARLRAENRSLERRAGRGAELVEELLDVSENQRDALHHDQIDQLARAAIAVLASGGEDR